MSILLISKDLKSGLALSKALRTEQIEVNNLLFQSAYQLIEYIKEYSGDFKAIILNKLEWKLDEIVLLLKEKDVFLIADNFSNIEINNDNLEELIIRVYLTPLNLHLLADDIKSITKLKEYVVFGSVKIDNFEINLNRRTITNGEKEIFLKNKEFELLLYLAQNKGKVLSRINILENVWDMNADIMTNTVDVHISKIRNIFKNHFGVTSPIKTIPCSGYILN